MSSATSSQASTERLIARFLREVAKLAVDLADELESMETADQMLRSLDSAGLGSLQRLVAEAPGMETSGGCLHEQSPNISVALTSQMSAQPLRQWRSTESQN